MSAPVLNVLNLHDYGRKIKFKNAFKQAHDAGELFFTWNGKQYNTISADELKARSFLNYKDLNARDVAAVNQSMIDNPTAWSKTEDWNKQKSGITINGHSDNLTNSEVQDFYRPVQGVSIVPLTVEVNSGPISIQEPLKTYNRADTREYMRLHGVNPYSVTGGDRNSIRAILNEQGSQADYARFAKTPGLTNEQAEEYNRLANEASNIVRTKAQTRDFIKGLTGASAYNYTGGQRAALRRVLSTGATNEDWNTVNQMYSALGNNAVDTDQYKKLQAIIENHNKQISSLKNGGTLTKKDAFVSYLADKNPDKDINKLIEELDSTPGNEGSKLDEQYKEFESMLDNSQSIAAKNGAKLNYLKSLRGSCPEGYETSYYKKGGLICSKCVEAEKGVKVKSNKKQFFKPSIPADDMPAKKCGGKAPQKACDGKKLSKKCEKGGVLYFYSGGPLQTVKIGNQTYGRYKNGQQWRKVVNGKLDNNAGRFNIYKVNGNWKAQIIKTNEAIQREQNAPHVVHKDESSYRNTTKKGYGVYTKFRNQAEAEAAATRDKVSYYDWNGKVYKTKWNGQEGSNGVKDNRTQMAGLYGDTLGWRSQMGNKSRAHRNSERQSANGMSDAEFNRRATTDPRLQMQRDPVLTSEQDKQLANTSYAADLMDNAANIGGLVSVAMGNEPSSSTVGLNPFGWTNDIVQGNYGNLVGRTLDLGTSYYGGSSAINGLGNIGNNLASKAVSWGGKYMGKATPGLVKDFIARPFFRTGLENATVENLASNTAKNAASKISNQYVPKITKFVSDNYPTLIPTAAVAGGVGLIATGK